MSGNIIQKITQIKENYILCQKMYLQYVCLSVCMYMSVCMCVSLYVCLSLMLVGVWVSVGHWWRRQWCCPAAAVGGGIASSLPWLLHAVLVQGQHSLLSRRAGWSRVTPGFGSVVCAGVYTAFQGDFGPGVVGGTYWVCRSCQQFQLMQVGVVGGLRRGCEQQQVAGVCEKAAAPVVIYTYRRAIV